MINLVPGSMAYAGAFEILLYVEHIVYLFSVSHSRTGSAPSVCGWTWGLVDDGLRCLNSRAYYE